MEGKEHTTTVRTLATFTGKSQIQREHSSSPSAEQLGHHKYTLTLYWFEGEPTETGRGCIEFDIPTLEDGENIGIWTECGELSDYDGTICELNPEMIRLLESVGIKVGDDFRPESEPQA